MATYCLAPGRHDHPGRDRPESPCSTPSPSLPEEERTRSKLSVKVNQKVDEMNVMAQTQSGPSIFWDTTVVFWALNATVTDLK